MRMPTVLVVDDDDAIREVIQIALEVVAGWQVITADGGTKALVLAREHHPDAVLLDVMMPDMDGPTTLQNIRRRDGLASTPTIFITARAQPHEKQAFLDIGAVGVITKPFDPMTLASDVRAILAAA